MGTDALISRVDGETITQDCFNLFILILSQNFVPRDESGIASNEGGSLGTEALQFRCFNEKVGGFSRGSIKLHFPYGANLFQGGGFMLCDGRIISKETYEDEHGAGTWDIDVGSTPLDGRYLPDYCRGPADRGRALLGVSSVSEDGLAPFSPLGNPDHLIDFSHVHQWNQGSPPRRFRYNSFQVPATVDLATYSTIAMSAMQVGLSLSAPLLPDAYTATAGPTSIGIMTENIPVQIYMRIV